ncbi:TrmH family RNA methyltransferase [Luteibaculum oceani]|uniref:RNA methyltransferase n=1 Tax=Luteibaculum oceani TaxID=1294296 RepID=A0A5C6VA82_9FLAO|nr:TrmH family RNA methyltransferase [Luteibaculum oceani]TXC81720.1 RNA methyltransferase [Luteibaculum oceani]
MANKKLKLDELNRVDPETFKQQKKHPITVVLDNVRSGLNVGSFFRTCDALAIERIILLGITPKPPHREILKSAIGATETVEWIGMETNSELIEFCKEQGLPIICVEQTEESKEIQRVNWELPCALVFGNEVDGVNDELITASYFCAEIPQFGTKHSFNVSVCGGVVLWDMIRTLITK